jgi:hypothetical protein
LEEGSCLILRMEVELGSCLKLRKRGTGMVRYSGDRNDTI